MAGQAEGVGDIAGRCRAVGDQELRQAQQPVAIGFCRLAADGAAGLGRNVGEVRGLPRDGTGAEVETEAELVEQRQLETSELDAEAMSGLAIAEGLDCKAEQAMKLVDAEFMEVIIDSINGKPTPVGDTLKYGVYISKSNAVCAPGM